MADDFILRSKGIAFRRKGLDAILVKGEEEDL